MMSTEALVVVEPRELQAGGESAERSVERVLELLRTKMGETGMTQVEVEQRAGMGRSWVSRLLSGAVRLGPEDLYRALDALEIEPGEFFAELCKGDVQAEQAAEPSQGEGEGFGSVRETLAALTGLLLEKGLVDGGGLLEVMEVAQQRGEWWRRMQVGVAFAKVMERIERESDSVGEARAVLGRVREGIQAGVLWPSETAFLEIGTQVARYAGQRRVEVACVLLANTRMKVGEISRLLGYEARLSTVFRRAKGMEPSQYRELYQVRGLRGSAWELRVAQKVAGSVLERVERDGVAAPVELRPVFDGIGEGLLVSGVDVGELTGSMDGSLEERFRETVGCYRTEYVNLRRLEAAEALLARSDLPIHRIGSLCCGTSSVDTFFRVFKRWKEMSASAYRELSRAR